MRIKENIRKILEVSDFFNSSQMIRFEKENQYKTITGGVVSLIIIIVVALGFTNQILNTLERTTISYTQNVLKVDNPIASEIVTSPENGFMFAIQILKLNLSLKKRYFDIKPYILFNSPQGYEEYPFKLVQCTTEHWQGMGNMDNPTEMKRWLCPQIGFKSQIFGKFTADEYQMLSIEVSACTNMTYDANDTTADTRPCASPVQIERYWNIMAGSTSFGFYYINTIINPDQPSYKQFYVEDTQYAYFGPTMGLEATLQLSDYSVTSDNSIWPFPDIVEDQGYFSDSQMNTNVFPLTNNQVSYVYFSLTKSSQKYEYTRSVQKISTVFSFIGGIIGALLTALFIMNSYTSFAFEVSMATEIFKKQQRDQNDQGPIKDQGKPQQPNNPQLNVSLYSFVKFFIYGIFKKIKKQPNWPDMQYLDVCHSQIIHQLDIKRIVKRLIFLQYCTSYLFDDGQLEGLKLNRPISPADVKISRQIFDEASQSQKAGTQLDPPPVQVKEGLDHSQNISKTPAQYNNREPQDEKSASSFDKNMNNFNFNQSDQIENQSNLQVIFKNPIKGNKKLVPVSHYLCERQRRSRNSGINLISLKTSAQKGDSVSKQIWLNILQSKKYGVQNFSIHSSEYADIPVSFVPENLKE